MVENTPEDAEAARRVTEYLRGVDTSGTERDPELDRLLAEEAEIEARVHTPDPADRVEPNWWRDHDNVATLASYLADHGFTAHDVAYAVEKPWKFEDEYREALRQ
jgi:hypothetical protein